MLQSKAVSIAAKRAAKVAASTALAGGSYQAYKARHQQKNINTNNRPQQQQKQKSLFTKPAFTSTFTTHHSATIPAMPMPLSFNTLFSVDDNNKNTSAVEEPQQTSPQQKEKTFFETYAPMVIPLFAPTDEESEKQRQEYLEIKKTYQEKLSKMTPEQRQEFEKEQSQTWKSRHERFAAADSPAASNGALIDDGRQTVILPVRILPNWHPLEREKVHSALGWIRYGAEHIFDFFRNRVDDLSYFVTGDYIAPLVTQERYDNSWEAKHPLVHFNPYYESIYRGWYSTTTINLKIAGQIPKFEYHEWVKRINRRPRVFLDFLIPENEEEAHSMDILQHKKPQRVVIQLYGDILPNSTENFLGLCDGFIDNDRYISYNNTLVHRIDRHHAFFCGDVLRRDGSAGNAFKINHRLRYLQDESFDLKIDGPGCVVYDNSGPNTNTSHFFITQRAMPELDGRYVCFGHVVEGMDVVRKVDTIPTNSAGVPGYPIQIVRSGIFVENPQKDDPFYSWRREVPEFKDKYGEAALDPITSPPQSIYEIIQQNQNTKTKKNVDEMTTAGAH